MFLTLKITSYPYNHSLLTLRFNNSFQDVLHFSLTHSQMFVKFRENMYPGIFLIPFFFHFWTSLTDAKKGTICDEIDFHVKILTERSPPSLIFYFQCMYLCLFVLIVNIIIRNTLKSKIWFWVTKWSGWESSLLLV